MRKSKPIAILLTVLVFAMGLTGCGLGKKSLNFNFGKDSTEGTTHEGTVAEEETEKTPLEILKEAQANFYKLSAVKQKVITENSGDNIDSIANSEAEIIYEFDANRGYIDMDLDGSSVAMFVEGTDKLYVKDDESGKYVDFSNNFLGKLLSSSVNFGACNEDYEKLSNSILDLVKDENITTKENQEKTINGKIEKVTKITVTIPQEDANNVLSEYMKDILKYTMEAMMDGLANFATSMEEGITGETKTEEEKAQTKEELRKQINAEIEKQLQSMSFSDIKNVYYIKDGIILGTECEYSITKDGETSNIKTTTELMEYGNSVKCPEISEENIISLEDIEKLN